jgi:hypothetical protein
MSENDTLSQAEETKGIRLLRRASGRPLMWPYRIGWYILSDNEHTTYAGENTFCITTGTMAAAVGIHPVQLRDFLVRMIELGIAQDVTFKRGVAIVKMEIKNYERCK